MFKSINGGKPPQRATKYSAGFDVFSNEDVVIGAGETKLIGLGIALDEVEILKIYAQNAGLLSLLKADFLEKHYLALHIRSSLRAKGLTSLGTGIIDMDYRDEIKMIIHNPVCGLYSKEQEPIGVIGCYTYSSDVYEEQIKPYKIKKGDKIGQLILCRHEGWLLPSEYTNYVERDGGFGSTGA